MLQKNTKFKPADNSGVLFARIFHIYRGSGSRFAYVGDFVKCSALKVIPDRPIKKKSKHRAIFIRSVCKDFRNDSLSIFFKKNACVLLKKKLTPRASYLRGPVSLSVKRRKFISSFRRRI